MAVFCQIREMQSTSRLRFDNSSPLFWRQSGSFVIGYPDCETSNAIEITNFTKPIATWLALVDGTRNEQDLVKSGEVLGIPSSAIRKLIQLLIDAGHIYQLETLPNDSAAHLKLPAFRFQANSTGHSISELLDMRLDFRIEITGAGSLPMLTYRLLKENAFSVGWKPNSNNRIQPEDLAPNFSDQLIGQRWNEIGTIEVEPKLQISFSDIYVPETALPQVPRLPVVWHSRRVAIGPLLNLPHGHCISCLHETRLLADSEWSFVLSQLLHNRRPLPRLTSPWLDTVANQIVLIASNLAESKIPAVLIDNRYELTPPHPIWQSNPWDFSTCGCRANAT